MNAGQRWEWCIASRLDALSALRAEVRGVALACGFGESAADDLALCVHEAASNAIVHGNLGDESRDARVTILAHDDALEVSVRNDGPGFDAASLSDSDVGEEPRGRGMRIISTLTDSFAWRDGGRELVFVKRV